jgi:hypothetical protein
MPHGSCPAHNLRGRTRCCANLITSATIRLPCAGRWAAFWQPTRSDWPVGRDSARVTWRYVGTGGVLMLLIVVSLQGHASVQTEPTRLTFHETTCDLLNVSPEIGPRLRCGAVSVPRDYANPGSGQFKLAVVVIKSARLPSLPDPVVYTSGGSGEPLTIYADHQARTPYAAGRDLILVDQRGTGRSEPNLCPEVDSKFLLADLVVASDDTDDALASRRATYLACREEALARGLDPRDFGTRVTVEGFRVGAPSVGNRTLERLRRTLWDDSRHDAGYVASRACALGRTRFHLSAGSDGHAFDHRGRRA